MRTPSVFHRDTGGEQPYWNVGPFKVRLPGVHYPLELVEAIQILIMFVVGLGMIPLLQQYMGMSYEVALTLVVVMMALFMLPTLLGVPFVPGWITPAIPLVLVFLEDYEPGPEAVKAMVAVQLLVTAIFLFLGVTKMATRLVKIMPVSIKSGIILGAGIAAILGEIEEGGRFVATPWSIGVGGAVIAYTMFSASFKGLYRRSRVAALIANYGLVPGTLVAIGVGWTIGEYPTPDIEWGITPLALDGLWESLPFTVGFPGPDILLAALPTAVIAYVIAYGDLIVGTTLVEESNKSRTDEYVEIDPDRVHLVTGLRNLLHSFFAPSPGQAGPIWTALTANVCARWAFGRKAMESIYSGAGTIFVVGFAAMFLLPLVTLFQPVLPIALSLALLSTGYVCLMVGMQQLKTPEQQAVAGITGVVIAAQGAEWGLGVGVILHVLVERTTLFGTKREAPPAPVTPEAEVEVAPPAMKTMETL